MFEEKNNKFKKKINKNEFNRKIFLNIMFITEKKKK
jgi:hypothetical protein